MHKKTQNMAPGEISPPSPPPLDNLIEPLADGAPPHDESMHYRFVLDASGDGMYDWDLRSNRVVWNHRFYETLGLSPFEQEPDFEFFTSLVHPDERSRVRREIEEHLTHDTPYVMRFRIRRRDGSYRYLLCRGRTYLDSRGEPVRMSGLVRDVTHEKDLEETLALRVRQQSVLARLGMAALTDGDVQALMDQMVAEVAQALQVEYCKVLELLPESEGNGLLLVSGYGWDPDLIGKKLISADPQTHAGYTLLQENPVVLEDLAAETRFAGSEWLHKLHTASGISVVIPGIDGPYGLLMAHSKKKQSFTDDDVNFFQAAANILAMTLRNRQTDQLMEQSRQKALRRANRERVHREILETINNTWDTNSVLDLIAEKVGRFLDADRCMISRFHLDGQDFRLEMVTQYQKNETVPAIDPDDVAYVAQAFKHIKPGTIKTEQDEVLAAPDAEGYLAYLSGLLKRLSITEISVDEVRRMMMEKYGTQAGLRVGITFHGKPYGSLSLQMMHKREWQEDEVQFVKNIAHQLGSVFSQDELYKKEQSARRDLEHYTRRLEASNRELEHFATVASHDLQAPVRKIIMFGDRLKIKGQEELSPENLQNIDRIQSSAQKMHELISSLLVMSRINRKNQAFEPVDLNQVITDVMADYDVHLEELGGQLTYDRLPVVHGDAVQLRQLFNNLIGNSIKYHKPGTPPHIHLNAEERKHDWRITVEDNGIGIEPDYRQQVFEAFRRLHTEEQYPGTGIGLALCKKIVERHGGDIDLADSPLGGTTVCITLPKTSRF